MNLIGIAGAKIKQSEALLYMKENNLNLMPSEDYSEETTTYKKQYKKVRDKEKGLKKAQDKLDLINAQ